MRYFLIIFLIVIPIKGQTKDFFSDITNQIQDNEFRLSYGVSVTDVNKDNKFDFVVTGFGFKNLALTYKNGKIVNIINEGIFTDLSRRTIGVAACDIDKDGYEEIYFLNTDTYSGDKIYSDRLLDLNKDKFIDLFEIEKNKADLNFSGLFLIQINQKIYFHQNLIICQNIFCFHYKYLYLKNIFPHNHLDQYHMMLPL